MPNQKEKLSVGEILICLLMALVVSFSVVGVQTIYNKYVENSITTNSTSTLSNIEFVEQEPEPPSFGAKAEVVLDKGTLIISVRNKTNTGWVEYQRVTLPK